MNRTPTIEEVFDFIMKVEHELDLINWTVRGEAIWGILRHAFCQNLFRVSGALENSKEPIEKEAFDFAKKIQVVTNIGTAVIIQRLFKKRLSDGTKQRAIGVFPFYRRNADNKDVHSQDVIEQLGGRALVFGVGEIDKKNPRMLHRAALNSLFSRLFGRSADRWIKSSLSKRDFELYRSVVLRCEKEFEVKLEAAWETLPIRRIKSYLTQSRGYGHLFRILNLSSIFVVSAIQQGLIGGARRANIRVIELQHGSISKFHPMFNWPPNTTISTVPDEFWAWGESWIEGISFAKSTKPIVVGAGTAYESTRSGSVSETKGLGAFMSSADVTEKLFSCALQCAIQNPEMTFVYKGHPREDLKMQKSELQARPEITNLTVVEKEYSALDLLARSEYIVGVNSTTLFEAAGMGKRVIVVKVSGWEIAQGLVATKGATLLNASQVGKEFKSTPRAENPYFFYSKRVNRDLSSY